MREVDVVGAVIVNAARQVLCARRSPAMSLPGVWEFPGGKVEPGEDEIEALVRECEEELGVVIAVGERLGDDVPMAHGWALLRVWCATLVSGEPQPLEHRSLRWLAADELDDVAWIPVDLPLVQQLRRLLT
jgi:8-oxo-dGTP diphosphatase